MTKKRILICSIILISLVGIIFTIKHTRHYFIWDNFGEVKPGKIYRSGQLYPHQLKAAIEKYGIRTILNLNHTGPEEKRFVKQFGVKYIRTRIIWNGNGVVPKEEIEWAYNIISNPKYQPILIHCARGTSRTGVVIAYYRMCEQGWSRQQIREEMKDYKHDPDRNPELKQLVDQLYEINTRQASNREGD